MKAAHHRGEFSKGTDVQLKALQCLVVASLTVAALTVACTRPDRSNAAVEVRTPNPDVGVDALAARRTAQMKAAAQFAVFHQFQFADRLKESGITFVHHIVEDAGVHYKAVHYDHGNGIAVADVDGDGLYDIYFVNQVGGNELWKNPGGGRFTNITKDAGVGLPDRISVTASFADIDNDGDQDLFVTTVRGGNVLFENDGHGHFKDITQRGGRSISCRIPPARCSSITTTTAWSISWSATSAATRPTRKVPTAPTSAWPMRFSVTCIRIDSSIPCCTRISATTGSRT